MFSTSQLKRVYYSVNLKDNLIAKLRCLRKRPAVSKKREEWGINKDSLESPVRSCLPRDPTSAPRPPVVFSAVEAKVVSYVIKYKRSESVRPQCRSLKQRLRR